MTIHSQTKWRILIDKEHIELNNITPDQLINLNHTESPQSQMYQQKEKRRENESENENKKVEVENIRTELE